MDAIVKKIGLKNNCEFFSCKYFSHSLLKLLREFKWIFLILIANWRTKCFNHIFWINSNKKFTSLEQRAKFTKIYSKYLWIFSEISRYFLWCFQKTSFGQRCLDFESRQDSHGTQRRWYRRDSFIELWVFLDFSMLESYPNVVFILPQRKMICAAKSRVQRQLRHSRDEKSLCVIHFLLFWFCLSFAFKK